MEPNSRSEDGLGIVLRIRADLGGSPSGLVARELSAELRAAGISLTHGEIARIARDISRARRS